MRDGWSFSLDAKDPANPEYPDRDPAALQAAVAVELEEHWFTNKGQLDTRYTRFTWAVVALGAEVVCWTVQLA